MLLFTVFLFFSLYATDLFGVCNCDGEDENGQLNKPRNNLNHEIKRIKTIIDRCKRETNEKEKKIFNYGHEKNIEDMLTLSKDEFSAKLHSRQTMYETLNFIKKNKNVILKNFDDKKKRSIVELAKYFSSKNNTLSELENENNGFNGITNNLSSVMWLINYDKNSNNNIINQLDQLKTEKDKLQYIDTVLKDEKNALIRNTYELNFKNNKNISKITNVAKYMKENYVQNGELNKLSNRLDLYSDNSEIEEAIHLAATNKIYPNFLNYFFKSLDEITNELNNELKTTTDPIRKKNIEGELLGITVHKNKRPIDPDCDSTAGNGLYTATDPYFFSSHSKGSGIMCNTDNVSILDIDKPFQSEIYNTLKEGKCNVFIPQNPSTIYKENDSKNMYLWPEAFEAAAKESGVFVRFRSKGSEELAVFLSKNAIDFKNQCEKINLNIIGKCSDLAYLTPEKDTHAVNVDTLIDDLLSKEVKDDINVIGKKRDILFNHLNKIVNKDCCLVLKNFLNTLTDEKYNKISKTKTTLDLNNKNVIEKINLLSKKNCGCQIKKKRQKPLVECKNKEICGPVNTPMDRTNQNNISAIADKASETSPH